MDFVITQNSTYPAGALDLNAKNPDIMTDIFNSVTVLKGSYFLDRNFGTQYVRKITDSNILLQRQYLQDALAWIIRVGRAIAIDVLVERDSTDFNRLNFKVTARQPNGLIVTYTSFKRVL
jgi:phage gp46-like protein